MAITTDILAAWSGPRRFVRAKLGQGMSEATILVLMMVACFLLFVARWPALAREAELQRQLVEAGQAGAETVPSLQALLGINLFVVLFLLPLVLFALAAISHIAARLAGGRGDHRGARLALVWALLATTPTVLFQGLLAGLVGPGPQLTLVGLLVAAAFVWMWLSMLIEVETGP